MFGFGYLPGMLLAPRRTATQVARAEPILGAATVVLAAAGSGALATVLTVRATTGMASGLPFLVYNVLLDLATVALSMVVALVFVPLVANHVLGGRGRAGELVWPLAYSFAPWTLWAGLGLCYQMTAYAALFHFLTQLGLVAWVLAIQVGSVAALFRISSLRALFALGMGYGTAAVLYLLFTALGTLGLFNTLVLWLG